MTRRLRRSSATRFGTLLHCVVVWAFEWSPWLPALRPAAGKRDRELAGPLLELGTATAGLLRISAADTPTRDLLREFWGCYIAALQAADLDLVAVASRNLCKASGRFLAPDSSRLPTFDEAFPTGRTPSGKV